MSLCSRICRVSFLIVFFGLLQTSEAISLYVPSDDYPTIQSAVDIASDVDVVEVVPGTYVEDIVIIGDATMEKEIVLRSNPGARIKGSITVDNALLDLDGFEIKPSKSSLNANGIVLQGAHGSRIRNCYIHSFSDSGIVIEGTEQVLVESNVVCGSRIGIECSTSTGTHIQFNSINGNAEFGVYNTAASSEYEVNASQNWWGDGTGPGGVGSGSGDAVSSNVLYGDWDAPIEEPTVTLTNAYVSGLTYRNTAYKGDIVDFFIEFLIDGGSDYAKYLVKAVARPQFGTECAPKKKIAEARVLVGQGLHTIKLTKRVPRCADDWTTGVSSIKGCPYEMEGSWVDINFRVTLQVPCEGKLDSDRWYQEAIFLVKKSL
jgi:hypothetical protein